MDLYFSPLACSMASRIALYEADASARFREVDPLSKFTLDGEDFMTVNPLGLVPAIRTDDGEVLTENAAILQYIADRFPDAGLAPSDGMARSRLHQWLCFIGTELHKALFIPLFDPTMPEEMKTRTLAKGDSRLAYLNAHLTDREFLLDRFSVADAYLVTVLNWKIATPVDLEKWPAVHDYYVRLKKRPSIARALAEEGALYALEQERHKAA
ncbi:glutathione S-transferase N-terminal domain-containing protein [Microvirga puerhi]|uniref:Glutathione S-transferase N-terminal domain-containing protein n=1 Tax=Microvirga puerhi TaxID=2876078 RepID=A0ABS7VRR9_9HYPH|nr:glutathione S-transferase N-terminal domain-containing protein [Microvirga puerhi]MBZ6077904.1 glutathione S-transferase N-terminal domain-containing protein [Microvirga puerhi]